MHQFSVSEDGRVHETSVRDSIERLKALFPEIDARAMEAHLMLERTHRLLASMRERHWDEFGLTPRRVILLRLLYTSEQGRLSMGEVAAHMNLAPNNVTQLVDGMERDGYVRRETGGEDKRIIYAVLTDQGEALFRRVFPETARRITAAWSNLNEDEKELLSHLLARLRMHLLTSEFRLKERDFPEANSQAEETKASRTRRRGAPAQPLTEEASGERQGRPAAESSS
ncbi:MAG TPA: MarR family transcriptional regulator [Dehalococcoidia bacterium]|nr:MarR family transcriptional regulator [Dehalococcoidia bacterium]